MKIRVLKKQYGLVRALKNPGAYNIEVTREDGPKFYRESGFWYALRCMLRESGYDVVRKRPDLDGHLTSMPYYIRDRKGRWHISDGNYAIRGANEAYNGGAVTLQLTVA